VHVAQGHHGLRFVPQTALGSLARALFGLIQFALFGLLTAILALKRPYLTLDVWVRRSPHEIGLTPAMWAPDWFNVVLLSRGGFFPRFNQFCHPGPHAHPTTKSQNPARWSKKGPLCGALVHKVEDNHAAAKPYGRKTATAHSVHSNDLAGLSQVNWP
jgi:hypothetical protein